jgi:hypothetical protein
MKWLENRLTALRYYEFITSIHTKSHPRKLDKIQLTPTGKTALASRVSSGSAHAITLESIAQDIKTFERKNPSVLLNLTATLREKD